MSHDELDQLVILERATVNALDYAQTYPDLDMIDSVQHILDEVRRLKRMHTKSLHPVVP